MHPFNKPLNAITAADIEALLQSGVIESRTLDYKRDLYGASDKDKKSFLIDVSALANTNGGYLVIGVAEDEGVPKSIAGVNISDFDKLKLHFENLLRMSVDPPIRGIEFQTVDITADKKVLVIEVPRSVNRPHAVAHNGYYRFHGRHSGGTYPFAVNDIKRAILESETIAFKLKSFRNDRIALISEGQTFFKLLDNAKTVLHIMPESAFDLENAAQLQNGSTSEFSPYYSRVFGGHSHRINFEGVITFTRPDEHGCVANYVQVFRNGIVEVVDAFTNRTRNGEKEFNSGLSEEFLTTSLETCLKGMEKHSVLLPCWLGVSLLSVRNFVLAIPPSSTIHQYPLDRNDLLIHELKVDSYNISPKEVLKPIFDLIANAFGLARSLHHRP